MAQSSTSRFSSRSIVHRPRTRAASSTPHLLHRRLACVGPGPRIPALLSSTDDGPAPARISPGRRTGPPPPPRLTADPLPRWTSGGSLTWSSALHYGSAALPAPETDSLLLGPDRPSPICPRGQMNKSGAAGSSITSLWEMSSKAKKTDDTG